MSLDGSFPTELGTSRNRPQEKGRERELPLRDGDGPFPGDPAFLTERANLEAQPTSPHPTTAKAKDLTGLGKI